MNQQFMIFHCSINCQMLLFEIEISEFMTYYYVQKFNNKICLISFRAMEYFMHSFNLDGILTFKKKITPNVY